MVSNAYQRRYQSVDQKLWCNDKGRFLTYPFMNYNKNHYMNKILFTLVVLSLGYTACKKTDFSGAYSDPSKVSETTVEKQFAGFLVNIKDYVVPSYWNYFVVLRPTVNRYTQVT